MAPSRRGGGGGEGERAEGWLIGAVFEINELTSASRMLRGWITRLVDRLHPHVSSVSD